MRLEVFEAPIDLFGGLVGEFLSGGRWEFGCGGLGEAFGGHDGDDGDRFGAGGRG